MSKIWAKDSNRNEQAYQMTLDTLAGKGLLELVDLVVGGDSAARPNRIPIRLFMPVRNSAWHRKKF